MPTFDILVPTQGRQSWDQSPSSISPI